MTRFAVHTAGESHGSGLLALVEGVPFGLELDVESIDRELSRRQLGYGRSSRMRLEHDRVEVLAGVYHGRTSGAPLVLRIPNVDRSLDALPPLHRPRPGHGDLAGALRFSTTDARPVLERASARETAARVAGGAVAIQVLEAVGVVVDGYVVAIGDSPRAQVPADRGALLAARDASDVGCPDPATSIALRERIAAAGAAGDTLGGIVEVVARGMPAGLGSLEQWWTRLDARIGAAMLSIPSAKGCEIGDGFDGARSRGSRVHDPIERAATGFVRPSNRAGGIEGGMSNGEPIVVRVALKPLSTLKRPLPSVDLRGGSVAEPDPQRSDVCAVPAGAVVAQAMLAIVLADAVRERFSGPTLEDLKGAVARELATRRERFFPGTAAGATS